MTKGELIKKARKAAGITQKELADRLEMTQAQISDYETGKRVPKSETLFRISEALEVSFRDFIPENQALTWEESVYSLGDAYKDAKALRDKLLRDYDSVNPSGKYYIADYAHIIASHPGFQREEYDPEPDEIIGGWNVPPFDKE